MKSIAKAPEMSCLAVLTLLIAPSAGAQIAFSSLTSSTVGGGYIWGQNLSLDSRLGFAFTPTISGNVVQVRAWVAALGASTAPIRMEIYADGAGSASGTPGNLLGSITGLAAQAPGPTIPVSTFTADGSIGLQAGQTYFFAIKRDQLLGLQWYTPAGGSIGPRVTFGEFNQGPQGQWEIAGMAAMPGFSLTVPAPAAGAALSGLMLIAATRRRRN